MAHLLLALIYLAFISLGLPDSLLGSAWPSMYPALGVPFSYAGIVSMIICAGTIVSSLMSDWLTQRLGAGKVTVLSVATTAVALFGFSLSDSFLLLCLWAIPYGLGAGSVDAALNNYAALHFESRHMSWLHCCWGIGASVGPYIMSFALTGGLDWTGGYRIISAIQVVLTAVLLLSLPIWKNGASAQTDAPRQPLTLPQTLSLPGAKAMILCFFCYCSLESTAGLWASSYLNLHHGMDPETAAGYASMFYLGITIGRAISGLLTLKLNDRQMIRLGQAVIAVGMALLFLPMGGSVALAGLVLTGLGCAPVYPCIIHSTPALFGAERSQALIGIQMASAYVGSCLMPPLFGLLARHITVALLPLYLAVLLAVMVLMYQLLTVRTRSAADRRKYVTDP